MKKFELVTYSSTVTKYALNAFEEALLDSLRLYLLRQLFLINDVSQENITEAIQKSLKVCHLAGIDSHHHFKKIYVFDCKEGNISVDWQMTRGGLNLVIMNLDPLSSKKARWLWNLANY
jgi:hypothetical protein